MPFILPEVEGLSTLTTAQTSNGQIGDKFSTPPSFDKKKFASRWVIDGPEVQEAQQDEVLSYANARAQGWAVYQQDMSYTVDEQIRLDEFSKKEKLSTEEQKEKRQIENNRKKLPYKRIVGKHAFILMFRPINLQKAVNQCYAAESRARVNLEITGETNSANEGADPGVLSNADLRKFGKLTGEQDETLPTTHVGPKADNATDLNLQ